ncbi:MAG TPA: hypothetical protein VK504_07520 [Vicinamibacterales bacterium]|jgi:hypothetical protein|nr:hypothetical protein [Vicinamibacterales bacterium]
MTDEQIDAYRHFAAKVAEYLTYVFTVEGYQRGGSKEVRAVLSAIREDLQMLRRTGEFPAPDKSATPEAKIESKV